jgi:hypothetical protein
VIFGSYHFVHRRSRFARGELYRGYNRLLVAVDYIDWGNGYRRRANNRILAMRQIAGVTIHPLSFDKAVRREGIYPPSIGFSTAPYENKTSVEICAEQISAIPANAQSSQYRRKSMYIYVVCGLGTLSFFTIKHIPNDVH